MLVDVYLSLGVEQLCRQTRQLAGAVHLYCWQTRLWESWRQVL